MNQNMLTFLLKQTKQYTKQIIWVILGLGLLSFFQFLTPQFTKNIIDIAIPNNNKGLLVRYILLMILLNALSGVLNYIVSNLMTHISQSSIVNLRTNLFRHILKQDFAFFENSKTGDLMTKLNSDIRTIQGLISTNSLSMISTMLQFFLILGFMFMNDFKLSLYIVMTFPVLYYLNKIFAKKMRQSHRSLRSNASRISNHLQTSLSSMLLIKNLNAEDISAYQYEKLNEEHLLETKKSQKLNATLSPVIQMVNTLSVAIVWLYGGFKIMKQDLTLGEITAYLSYLSMVQSPIRSFSSMVHRYQEAQVSFERIADLLQSHPSIVNAKNPNAFSHQDITFENISFSYDQKQTVIHDLNMTLKKGETSALVGSSGSGKTTLAKLLSRLYDPTQGHIYIGHTPLNEIELEALRENIAIVSQDVILIDGTIKENIIFGHEDINEDKLIEAAKNANIYDFIQSLPGGFNTQVGERGVKLSGGQKQRIAIARIFLKDAPILILDEATAALDNKSEKSIQNALERLMKNRTTLVIAHRLSTIKQADQIMVMEEGQIIEKGNHEALLNKQGHYYDLYTAQFN